MPIGGGRKTGGIGGPSRKGPIGSFGSMTGDSLGPGTSTGKPRSAYWLQYPNTTSTSTTSSSTTSTTKTTTTTTTTAP